MAPYIGCRQALPLGDVGGADIQGRRAIPIRTGRSPVRIGAQMRSRWAGKPALAGAQGCVSSPEALQAGPVGPGGNAGKLAVAGAQMRLAR